MGDITKRRPRSTIEGRGQYLTEMSMLRPRGTPRELDTLPQADFVCSGEESSDRRRQFAVGLTTSRHSNNRSPDRKEHT